MLVVKKERLDKALEIAREARCAYLASMREDGLSIAEIVDNDTHLQLVINLCSQLLAGEKVEVEK
nr:MAG TPA: hypothetical protein [Caudoviricetes sp.]